MATVSDITVRSLCDNSVSWQKSNTKQLYSLVAETINNMVSHKTGSSCRWDCIADKNVIKNIINCKKLSSLK
jgi:hypothetical protein